MKTKFDIFKTFELFNKENMSILRDKIVEIILVEADNIFSKKNKKMFELDLKKNNSVQVTVMNDKGTFDLLSNTWKRYRTKQMELIKKELGAPAQPELPPPQDVMISLTNKHKATK